MLAVRVCAGRPEGCLTRLFRLRRAIFAVAAFAWAAPQVQKSLSGIRKAEYEIATPMMHERMRSVIDVAVSCASWNFASSWVSRPMVSIGGTEMKFVYRVGHGGNA